MVPASAVRGSGESLKEKVRAADFLAYCLLNVIQRLNSQHHGPDYVALAVHVDAKRLSEQVDALASDEKEALERVNEAMKLGAATRSSYEGRGLLGVIVTAGFIGADMAREQAFVGRFLQKFDSISDLKAKKEQLLVALREQASSLEDTVYRDLTQRGVTVLERRTIEKILEENQLSLSDDFKPTHTGDLLTATHLLVLELGQAQDGGNYHITATLADCRTGNTVWTDHRDRAPIQDESGFASAARFVVKTGPLAAISRGDNVNDQKLVHMEYEPQLAFREVLQMNRQEISGSLAKIDQISGDGEVKFELPAGILRERLRWGFDIGVVFVAGC
jgi:hypothetical protein